MMTIAKVTEYLSAEPFQPFRIKMASGASFEIKHPEMILVGRTSATVYTTTATDPDKPPRWHDVSLMLMETLEPLDLKSSLQTEQN